MSLSLRVAVLAAMLASALGAASAASATTLVDTSTLRGLTLSNSVDASNWIAESFTLGGTDLLVDSVAALVMSTDPSGDAGRSFTLAVYADDPLRHLPSFDFNADNHGALFQVSLTYTADGWASASGLNWQFTPGTFWFAIESSADGPTSLQVPSGATPAPVGVAYDYGHRAYTSLGVTSDDAFGLRVSAVPEPAPAALLATGLAVVALSSRRRRAWRSSSRMRRPTAG